MKNYPFRVLHCELNYLDLKWHACLSDNLVLCNVSNSFDVSVKAKLFHCVVHERRWSGSQVTVAEGSSGLAWWKIPDIRSDTTWPLLSRRLCNPFCWSTPWTSGTVFNQAKSHMKSFLLKLQVNSIVWINKTSVLCSYFYVFFLNAVNRIEVHHYTTHLRVFFF